MFVHDRRGVHTLTAIPYLTYISAAAETSGELRAPMMGMILKVNVAVGDRIKAGDVAAILESMKMELRISSEIDGVVAGGQLPRGRNRRAQRGRRGRGAGRANLEQRECDMRLGSVNYETRGKVAILTLDEPHKLNALSAGIREGILEGLKKADADHAIRVAIITGSGDKAFCAGADIGDFDFDPEKARSFLIAAIEVLAAPENTRKPVICAVNGIAYGGGFELAIASDFIIASDRAKFAVPEIKLGLLPGFAIVRLQDIVGRAKAKEMSMLGDPISAEEAFRLGLALRVVPHADVLADALAFADQIASKPRLAVRMAKSFYNRGLGGDDMRHAIDGFPLLFMHEDAREGVAAFREKRQPKFSEK